MGICRPPPRCEMGARIALMALFWRLRRFNVLDLPQS
jgi:hypothetical protein